MKSESLSSPDRFDILLEKRLRCVAGLKDKVLYEKFQFITDPRDGLFKLMEINPHFQKAIEPPLLAELI